MKMLSLIRTSVSAHSSASRMAQRGWEGRRSVNGGTGCLLWDRGVIQTIWQKQYDSCTFHIATQDERSQPTWTCRTRGPGHALEMGQESRRPAGRPSHALLCSREHLYSAGMTPATIIKPRSLWIIRSDDSTFVIQLQINPFCSAL